MITQEMLDEYGCDRLLFKKTGQTALDSNGEALDMWLLAFIGNVMKRSEVNENAVSKNIFTENYRPWKYKTC